MTLSCFIENQSPMLLHLFYTFKAKNKDARRKGKLISGSDGRDQRLGEVSHHRLWFNPVRFFSWKTKIMHLHYKSTKGTILQLSCTAREFEKFFSNAEMGLIRFFFGLCLRGSFEKNPSGRSKYFWCGFTYNYAIWWYFSYYHYHLCDTITDIYCMGTEDTEYNRIYLVSYIHSKTVS